MLYEKEDTLGWADLDRLHVDSEFLAHLCWFSVCVAHRRRFRLF